MVQNFWWKKMVKNVSLDTDYCDQSLESTNYLIVTIKNMYLLLKF